MKFEVQFRGTDGPKTRNVELQRVENAWQVFLEGERVSADVAEVAPDIFSVLLNGRAFEIRVFQEFDGVLQLQIGGEEFVAEVMDTRAWRGRHSAAQVEGRQQIVAPMPGKIVRVLVQQGETVVMGQGLLVVEAMKMQNEIRSPKNGKVEQLQAREGQSVNTGEILGWVD
jgi:biotin carboxyl carrier protein